MSFGDIHADNQSFNLPADVFIEGEVRPTKAKKKAAPKTAATKFVEAADKKRSFSSTGLDVSYCKRQCRMPVMLFRESDVRRRH